MKVAIIEDNELDLMALEKVISNFPELKILYKENSAEKALDFFENNSADLFFLDIELPGINGIDFIKKVKNVPQIIIVSSNPDYAVEAYDFDVIDYVVKPVSIDRIEKALKRVEKSNSSFYIRLLYYSNRN